MNHYQVKHGDSALSIAHRHGVTLTQLLAANPGKPQLTVHGTRTWKTLRVGETVTLPGFPKFGLRDSYGYKAGAPSYGATSPAKVPGGVASYGAPIKAPPAAVGPVGVKAPPPAPGTGCPPGTHSACVSSMLADDFSVAETPWGIAAGGLPPSDQAVVDAANAAAAAVSGDPNACNNVCVTGSPVNVAVHNFKAKWNAVYADTPLEYNGQYDDAVAGAIASEGVAAPPACGTRCGGGGPPQPPPCPAGQVNDTVTFQCVAPCPNGGAPVNGACAPAPSTGTNWGAIIAAALLVGGGVAATTVAVRRRRRRHAGA